MAFVTFDAHGAIAMYGDWPFDGSTYVDYEIVRGWDDKFYRAGEEPSPSEDEMLESKLNDINERYNTQYESLKDSMSTVQLIDGASMESAILALREKWNQLTVSRDNEINQLLGG